MSFRRQISALFIVLLGVNGLLAGCSCSKYMFHLPNIIAGSGDYVLVDYDANMYLSVSLTSKQIVATIQKADISNRHQKGYIVTFLGYNDAVYAFDDDKLICISLINGAISFDNRMTGMRFYSKSINSYGGVIIRDGHSNYLYSVIDKSVRKISDSVYEGCELSDDVFVLWDNNEINIYDLKTLKRIDGYHSDEEISNVVIGYGRIIYATDRALRVYDMKYATEVLVVENVRFSMAHALRMLDAKSLLLQVGPVFSIFAMPALSREHRLMTDGESEYLIRQYDKYRMLMNIYYYHGMIIILRACSVETRECKIDIDNELLMER